MTHTDQIMSMWRRGMNTHKITREMTILKGYDVEEDYVHKIIIAEREARLAKTTLKTIQGGAANAK